MREDSLVDDSFNRRVKALARTGPVHNLEAHKHARDEDWSRVDLRGLALAAIDEVIDHMGLEYGATAAQVRDRVATLAQAALEPADAGQAARVAAAVLEALLNDGQRREAFAVAYSDWSGPHRRAELVFKLLEEIEAPDGSVVLRATDEAINLFVGALDRDIEDAQAAAEAVLSSQLRRGRIDQAVVTAREARLRSIQYATRIRRILETTRRDVRQVDWGEDVPALLDDAVGHLGERLDVERRLLGSLRDTLDEVGEADAADAAELVRLVEDCQQRHVELHRELLGARGVFLEAQQRQRFAAAAETRLCHLDDDVLKPLLRGAVAASAPAAAGFLVASRGPRPVRQTRLSDLVDALLRPRRAVAEQGAEALAPDLVALDVAAGRYPPEARSVVAALLGGLAGPTRLSQLLAPARSTSAAAAELLAVSVLHAFASESAQGAAAADDGERLDDTGFGGADLLLAPASPS